MIKGKSTVSEEIELNHRMAEACVSCLESDMGEYIVQLAGERPSHIIMPAIHETKEQIAALFAERIPETPYTEDVDELIAIGRRVPRNEFRDAKIGVSGVNFMVADTSTLVLVEKEGNGRMCTTAPEMHFAITGIEKVVERFEHVLPLFSLLTRSVTGQAVTTYFNAVSGPRRASWACSCWTTAAARPTATPTSVPRCSASAARPARRCARSAKHEPAPGHPPLTGQGSAKDWREALAWKIWAWLERPCLYRGALSLGHRLHALVPAWQGGRAHRTPMRPAARGLRERLAAQQRREG